MSYLAPREATLHGPDERPLIVRYRPGVAVSGVDLLGEVDTWLTPVPMRVSEGQTREATLRLASGVYAYKFRHDDGSYHLDPAQPRTLCRDGQRNSVLVVDGTPEPVLHAPRAPYLWRRDDGRMCVRAALRHGAGHGLSVRWDEGHGTVHTPMREVAREDEHALFEAHLPVSSARFHYLFELASGELVGRAGEHGAAFVHTLESKATSLPAWWREGVMYALFVDRFRRGGGELWPLSHERGRAGGDLWGVIEALPYLEQLGVNIVQLTPIALSPSAHRYDAIDPRVVDPELGGERALEALLAAAEARHMRVCLDVAATHVHRDHVFFRDVREKGPRSPYWPWFYAYDFPFVEGPDGGYVHYPKGQWQEPLLRTTHPEVVDYIVGHFEHYARMGVHGFRLDAACSLPVGLARKVRQAVQRIRPDAVLWGEVTVDNTQRWLSAGALDAATEFVAQAAERSFLRGESDAQALRGVLGRRRFYRAGEGPRALAFVANHDQTRLTTLLGDARLSRAAHVLLLARAELPALYYGDERGVTSSERERNFEDAWPDRAPLSWQDGPGCAETHALVCALTRLRRESEALRGGDEAWLGAESEDGRELGDVLLLRRSAQHEVVEVYLHRGAGSVRVRLASGAPLGARVLVASGPVTLHDGVVELGPTSAVMVRRELSPDVASFWQASTTQAEALAREAFVRGACTVPSLPPRLYLTVTERCNLRCAHCITHAPQLTREGTARSLSRWLWPRLRDAFAAASYLGFVHGGESLVSEAFFPTLAYVQAARSQAHGRLDIHLLSNGMLLSEERVQRLIDHGVTSLSVSLDGASPRSNDKLRIGGSFTTVVRHLEAALALRARTGADLRIGISTVLGRSAREELPLLGDLCTRLGVDWLKLEEMVGVTCAASEERLASVDARAREDIAMLHERLSAAGIVLVDHTEETRACACSADARARAFHAADDFANRAHFRRCRMLWEQVAIDPDGGVRPVDYGHGRLGSLLESELVELWNAPELQAARARLLSQHTPAARAQCARG